jgi:hypothetical protein
MKGSLASFDYGIKYLIEERDFSIVEGFASAFLTSIGYSDVKIIGLLEAENKKESSKTQRVLADLVVEDKDHHKYIVEIERRVHPHFVHKAYFGTSRLLIDTLGQSQDYGEILKIFHISLLYFSTEEVSGVAYHGKTLIRELTTDEKLTLHITDPKTKQVYDATEVQAAYFYLFARSFNDHIEKELDEWFYVMKHNEVPKNYHSKYMEQVAEKLSILKMTDYEGIGYYVYLNNLYTDEGQLQTAFDRGMKEGLE